MRKLTQQEIDNAPDWATNYLIKFEGEILWESEDFHQINNSFKFSNMEISICSKPIPRPSKEFDINKYEFIGDIGVTESDGVELEMYSCHAFGNCSDFELCRSDVIAIAKHFKLTMDDLK